MREIKRMCYQRSFTSRYMKIVLLKADLNLSCCEGSDFIFFFPVNVWKSIAFSFPFLSFQCKKLTMSNKTLLSVISSLINFSHTSCISLALEEVNIPESTNFLTCTLGSCRSISSLRLVTLDGIYPRGKAAVSLRSSGSVASHADVLRGSSRVPAPRVTNP